MELHELKGDLASRDSGHVQFTYSNIQHSHRHTLWENIIRIVSVPMVGLLVRKQWIVMLLLPHPGNRKGMCLYSLSWMLLRSLLFPNISHGWLHSHKIHVKSWSLYERELLSLMCTKLWNLRLSRFIKVGRECIPCWELPGGTSHVWRIMKTTSATVHSGDSFCQVAGFTL